MDDKQPFFKIVVIKKKKRNLLSINGLNKGKKLKQVTLWHIKFLKDGSLKNDMKSFTMSIYTMT